MSYTGKVYRKQGGDELVVQTGGVISAAGTQASAITDAKVDYTTGDLDAEAEVIAAVNATNGAVNDILAALRGVGIIAS